MKLLSLVEVFGTEASAPIPELELRRCLHHLDRFHLCGACGDVCPVGAIRVGTQADGSAGLPRLEREACRHCLACLPACPTGAFVAEDPAPDLVRCAARMAVDHLELLCVHHPDHSEGPGRAAITVRSCLAGLGSGAYLALAARGVAALSIRTDACADCPWGALAAQVEVQVSRARVLLNLWPQPLTLTLAQVAEETWQERPVYRAESPPFTRRSLVRLAREGEETSVAAGTHPFHERLRTMHSIQAFPSLPACSLGKTVPAEAGFAMITVRGWCSACGTCARVCPTGALETEVDDDRFRLTFAPEACVACDLCARLCPEEVIRVEHRPQAIHIFGSDHFLLYESACRRCARCNMPFAPQVPDATTCDICTFRRENPFAMKMPPRLGARRPTENSGE